MYLVPPELKQAPQAKREAQRMLDAMGPMKKEEMILATIFVTSIALWMLGDFTGIGSTLVGFLAVCSMLFFNILNWDDVLGERGAWDTLMWMGVLVCMAGALTQKGFMVWLGAQLGSMFSGMDWVIVTLIISVFFNYTQYAFASSTAHMVALYGACLTVMLGAGCPPMVAILLLAYIANTPACMTPYTCGFAPIYFNSGYFTSAEFWRIGFIMSWLHLAIVLVTGPLWWKIIGFW